MPDEKRVTKPQTSQADFPRPDAERTAHGAPAHEESQGGTQADDRRHGYSQESGYQSSGGPPSAGAQRAAENVGSPSASEPTGTSQPKGSISTLTDEQIRDEIHQRLVQEAEEGSSGRLVVVEVGDGMVTLKGEVPDEREIAHLVAVVSSIRAVRGVKQEFRVAKS